MLWILFAVVSPMLYAVSNVLDNYLSNRVFKQSWVLAFYAVLLNVVFLPLVAWVQMPMWPPMAVWPLIVGVSLTEIFYLYPYYKALQSHDTSIVISLFALGNFLTPVLAYLLIGEVLNLQQYLGVGLILLSSAALNLEKKAKLIMNKALGYMLLCSLILSVQAVLYKSLLEKVDWSTGLVWTALISSGFIALLCMLPVFRRKMVQEWRSFRQNLKILVVEETFTFMGSASSILALTLAPVTIVNSIGASQPFFVLIYALIFGRYFPQLFREKVDRRALAQKAVFFAITLLGIVLVVG